MTASKKRDGFRKRVSKAGVVTYQVRVFTGRDARGVAQYYVETVHGGIKAAKERRDALRVERANRRLVSTRVTVAEHVRDRIDQWQSAGDISLKTAERYRQLYERQIAPHIGQRMVRDLRPLDIERWHTILRTDGRKGGGAISARTIGHAHRVLAKALGDAVRHALATTNVAAGDGQRAPRVEETTDIVIVPEDRIGDVIDGLRGRPIYAKAITSLFTGARRGEVLALRWNAVDLDKKEARIVEALEETKEHGIRFKSAKTKAGRRTISLPDIVVEALRDHRRQQLEQRMALGLGRMPADALVFSTLDGGPTSPLRYTMDWTREAERLGMGEITLHALRHTHASQLIAAKVDVVTISKRLGHATPNVTLQVYAHMFKKRDDQASDAINAALAGMAGRRPE